MSMLRPLAKRVVMRTVDNLMRANYFMRTIVFTTKNENPDRLAQISLMLQYQNLIHSGKLLPTFADVEFSSFSQNGEDGICLYIFALIGMENRRSVEICAGTGTECNTANLIINHGFHGLLFDGSEDNIRRADAFYATRRETRTYPPTLVHSWITRDNVNDLIRRHGFDGEIDLLSLDLDGVDYWIWRAIDCVQPRVVVLEFNNLWPADKAVTVPYRPDFTTYYTAYGAEYAGASLLAFVKLGREKGYRLVGCQRYGFNAVFLRNGVGDHIFPEIEPSACLQHPYSQHAMNVRLEAVIHKEWVEV